MDALKTAYATAYSRLLLLAKEGKIGEIYSVDATCTSLRSIAEDAWDSICDWGPTAMLPIFNILGNDYKTKNIITHIDDEGHDQFTRITFLYDHAVACTNQTVIQPVITSTLRSASGQGQTPRVPDAPKIKHDKMKQFYMIDMERKIW